MPLPKSEQGVPFYHDYFVKLVIPLSIASWDATIKSHSFVGMISLCTLKFSIPSACDSPVKKVISIKILHTSTCIVMAGPFTYEVYKSY